MSISGVQNRIPNPIYGFVIWFQERVVYFNYEYIYVDSNFWVKAPMQSGTCHFL